MSGKVITFYSYKGGVGRSMTLANVGVLMAKWGYKVLLLDWDFEAPGLEFYFEDFINQEHKDKKSGIIDILAACCEKEELDWRDCVVEINVIDEDNKNLDGELFLITSGSKDENYFQKVRNFDFNDFYTEHSGGNFIESIRDEWKENYDFILVDSRTGISDTGGVCTILLPEVLVLLFTATKQGLEGIKKVGESINIKLSKLPIDRNDILMLPVPTRIELRAESEKAKVWIDKFSEKLPNLLGLWFPEDKLNTLEITNFFNKIFIKPVPYYSFGETLPVIDDPVMSSELRECYSKVASLLCRNLNDVNNFIENSEIYITQSTKAKVIEARDTEVIARFLKYQSNLYSVAVQHTKVNLKFKYFYIFPKLILDDSIASHSYTFERNFAEESKSPFFARKLMANDDAPDLPSKSKILKKTPDFLDYFLKNNLTKIFISGTICFNSVKIFSRCLSYIGIAKIDNLEEKFIQLKQVFNEQNIKYVFQLNCMDFINQGIHANSIINSYVSETNNDDEIKETLARLISKNVDDDKFIFIFQNYEDLTDRSDYEKFVRNFNDFKRKHLYKNNVVIVTGDDVKLDLGDRIRNGENELLMNFTRLNLYDLEDAQRTEFIGNFYKNEKISEAKKITLEKSRDVIFSNDPVKLFEFYTYVGEGFKSSISNYFDLKSSKIEFQYVCSLAYYVIKNDIALFSQKDEIAVRNLDERFLGLNLSMIITQLSKLKLIRHEGRDIDDNNLEFINKSMQNYLAGNAIVEGIDLGEDKIGDNLLLHFLDDVDTVQVDISDEVVVIPSINQKWYKVIAFALSCLETDRLNKLVEFILISIKQNITEEGKAKTVLLTNAVVEYLPSLDKKHGEEIIKMFIAYLNNDTDLRSHSGQILSIVDEVDSMLRKSEIWKNYYHEQLVIRLTRESRATIDDEAVSQKTVLVNSLCRIYTEKYCSNVKLCNFLDKFNITYANDMQLVEYSMIIMNVAFEESRKEKESKTILTAQELEKYNILGNLFGLLSHENDVVSIYSSWALGWLAGGRDEDTYGIWHLNEKQAETLITFINNNPERNNGFSGYWLYQTITAEGYQKWYYPDKEQDKIYDWATMLDAKLAELKAQNPSDESVESSADTYKTNDIVIKSLADLCYQVKGKDSTGKVAWYFVLIDKDKKEEFLNHIAGDSYDIADYGKIIESGYGDEPPVEVKERLKKKYGFDNF